MPFSIFILIDLTALQKYLPSEKDLRTNLACTVQSAKQTFPFLQDTPMAIGGQEEDGTFMVFKNVYINPWNFIPIHSSVACHFYTACISNLLPVYHIFYLYIISSTCLSYPLPVYTVSITCYHNDPLRFTYCYHDFFLFRLYRFHLHK